MNSSHLLWGSVKLAIKELSKAKHHAFTTSAGHLTVAKLLLDEGADIEQRNVMKETALIRAAHNGHLQTVRFLLQRGADVDSLDLGDNTALHWAAMRGHVEAVRLLLQHGADRRLRNKQDREPSDLCQACWSHSWRFAREVLQKN